MSSYVLREALLLVVLGSLVPLSVSAVSGLFVSLLQAATQIQEQTTPYLIKLISFSIVCFFFGSLASQRLIVFTQLILKELSRWRY